MLGKPVAQSPYTVRVRDDMADPSKTHAWGPGLGKGVKTGTRYLFVTYAYRHANNFTQVGVYTVR